MKMETHSALSLLEENELKSLVQSEFPLEAEKRRTIVNDVEVLPPTMAFVDAYEGKEFSKRLTLKNIGRKTAFVRIGAPTANTFRLKPMKQVCALPPGLALSRMIRMKYSRAFAVHDAQIPIYINEFTIQYSLTIFLNQARIVVEPTEVNFGRIDAVSSVVAKTVVVRNIGSKNTGFCIDLGRNELELIVEPTRGVLQASESVTLKLEVMGFYEGPFRKEFWIKTVPPKRVTVVGEFITPKVIATYPKAYADFSMVIFPRLYLGQTATRTLMVKNISSSDVMFCIKGMHDKQYKLYKEVAKVNDHYRSFQLTPLEGRLGSQQTTVVEIIFEPVESSENHAVCFIQVIRVNCTDVDDSVVIRVNEAIEPTSLGHFDRSRSSLMTIASSMPQAGPDDELLEGETENIANLVTEEKIAESESFRVCLYGDKEKAQVKLRPESISLNQIQTDDIYYRELWFENCSSYLPITVNYLKVAYIDVEPPKIFLKPKETREVIIKVKPKKAGHYSAKVAFELLVYENYDYTQKKERVVVGHVEMKISFIGLLKTKVPKTKFNMKMTPNNLNEVGFMVGGIQFNTRVDKPKAAVVYEDKLIFRDDDSDLIAFPNDRPQSLRPWIEEKPCKTIFAKIPRIITTHDEYSYSPITLYLKRENRNYYIQYLREQQEKAGLYKEKKIPNYEITRKWMFERYACEMVEEKEKRVPISAFVPLAPIVLHNVKIKPRYIRLQRVAPISNVEHQFTILNDNSFPIFIYVTSVKPGIYFPQGHCKIVTPHETKVITLTCFAGLVGRYINLIQVIVNFCHLYTISVMVEVVPKMINLDENVLNFEPEKSGNIKFIELQNHLNSSISFSTEMSFSRFKIQPPSGTILQKRTILCAIRYDNLPEMPDYSELVLTSEGGGSQIMQISRKKEKPAVELLPPRLSLTNLPLNIKTKHLIRIKNLMNYDICFFVVDPQPLCGIEIFPFQGVINGVAEIELTVTIIIDNSENFETQFEFILEDQFNVFFPVQGQIIIPTVDIRPENIVNRALIPFAYRRNIFYVKNESTCDCLVRFDLDQYEYFRVTEKETEMDSTIHNTNLKLLPGEVKMLYLHFSPMDALTESFYMPIIINDIVGPPVMSNVDSVHFSLGERESSTVTKLPCLKITSICGTTTLHFSTLKLTFSYALSDVNTDQLIKFFTAKNLGNDPIEFCIRTDKIISQFYLAYHSGAKAVESSSSMICRLNTGESTIFVVKFLPSVPGKFVNNLSIYVRNYLDGCAFNYLRLIGTYEEPSITAPQNTYYLGCTPVGFKSAVMLDLNMKYHDEGCQVHFDPSHPDVIISFRERASRKYRNITKAKLQVACSKPTGIFTEIKFHCSCGASCTIQLIAFCDYCYLSHYAFFGNNKPFFRDNLVLPAKNFEFEMSAASRHFATVHDAGPKTSPSVNYSRYIDLADYPENLNTFNFPFFPLIVDDDTDYQYHFNLRATLKFVEKWISSQGFYKTTFFRIPHTIALDQIVIQKDNLKKDMSVEPTILTFLVELGGVQVREASISSKVTNFTPKNIALHFFTTYYNMLRYLEEQGALLPHVLPELLLSYEFYQIIADYFPDSLKLRERFDEKSFYAYSARCYLDLILQSIKIYILNRIKMFDIEIGPPSSEDMVESDERLSGSSAFTPVSCQVSIVRPNSNIYTKNEHILLYWLQYHFDNQKNRLWKSKLIDELTYLQPKEIKLFDEDLNDSLVFACVTVAYCPYLAYTLVDMYVPPTTFEEYHHNACRIIKAWNLLNFSYSVEPDDIVNPNGINMILLILYLYEILPSFFPNEVLSLQAKLTQVSRANLSLTNFSEHQIVYAVTFFGNESGSFSSETEVFRLQPKKIGTLKIKYQAKKISSQKAILVLSGELPGQKYGRSRAINLNGITDLNYSTKHIEFKCDCYKIHKMKINLHSPYNVPDTYEIWYAVTDDHAEEEHQELELNSWKEYVLGKVPKRMYSREYQFTITNPEEGFIFEPIICCQMIPTRIYKMFMVGQHGDWCFDVRIVPKMSKQNHEVINVSLPRGFNSQACSCRERSTEIPLICPRTIHINIPSKNNLFYKSTREMFIACTDEQFLAFWKKYLPIRAVFNVLRSLFNADKSGLKIYGYAELLQKSHTFNVYTEVNSPFTAIKQVTIEDVSSDKSTEILIHANSDFDLNSENYLELESLSGLERRYYKLNFYTS